jgi:hypothetical protein
VKALRRKRFGLTQSQVHSANNSGKAQFRWEAMDMRSIMALLVCIVVLALSVILPADEMHLMWNAKADLNGDGKPETIRLVKLEGNRFRLHINQDKVEDELLEEAEGFYIANVDKSDKYREVVVYTPGPSDDDEHVFFWFDGKRIRKMGHLMRWLKFLGNGIVLANDWMGFWTITRKYVLTKDRKLVEVPQEFYHVGVTGKVSKPLTLYRTRQTKQVLATLRVGSNAEIILSDSKGWYLIKSENRLLGWAKEESLMNSMSNLPIAD